MVQVTPIVPRNITVHLAGPNAPAQNATVSFPEYIKNVASSEIYPTWDEDALRANILAQISFALNRVYTEFYRAQGKDFDITASTAIDQKFILGRNIFESVERIVDEIFNDYIRRIGFVEPLAAKFCNGTTVTCEGLSQWGSENLAQQGYNWLDILYRYYGYNIEIVVDAPIADIRESYPGYPIRRGDSGPNVQVIQVELNRISVAYPAIPKVYPVDGIFGQNTESAVRTFQRIFNLTQDGIVGRATWYRLVALYTGLQRLSELASEGQRLYSLDLQYPDAIGPGDSGEKVEILQYFIAIIAEYNVLLAPIRVTGVFDEPTQQAVIAFQTQAGLPVTGTVGEDTWNALYDAFVGILETEYLNNNRLVITTEPFPGEDVSGGEQGIQVIILQEMLSKISQTFGQIPNVAVTGFYDAQTEAAVRAFQQQNDLPETGVTDRNTWNAIATNYRNAVSASLNNPRQFPGRTLREGDRDTQDSPAAAV